MQIHNENMNEFHRRDCNLEGSVPCNCWCWALELKKKASKRGGGEGGVSVKWHFRSNPRGREWKKWRWKIEEDWQLTANQKSWRAECFHTDAAKTQPRPPADFGSFNHQRTSQQVPPQTAVRCTSSGGRLNFLLTATQPLMTRLGNLTRDIAANHRSCRRAAALLMLIASHLPDTGQAGRLSAQRGCDANAAAGECNGNVAREGWMGNDDNGAKMGEKKFNKSSSSARLRFQMLGISPVWRA